MNDDLISRRAAIDAIEEYADRLQMVNWKENPGVPYKVHALNWCINTIRDLPSAQQEYGRWIPCEERMPEEPFGCLVTVMDTEPMTWEEFENILPYFVGWDGEQWSDEDGLECPFEVLAWMPLPKPWKMNEEDEV